jgi:hypothetical protein
VLLPHLSGVILDKAEVAADRFFCANPECAATTFAEQFDGLTSPYARRSPPLAQMLTAVAEALAGRPGRGPAGAQAGHGRQPDWAAAAAPGVA